MTIEGWPPSRTLAEAALGLWGPQCPVVLCSLAGAGGSPGWDRWLRAGDPQYLVFHDRGHVRQPPHHFGTIWKGKNETPRDERLPGVVVYFSAMLLFLLALFGVDIFKLVFCYFLADRGHMFLSLT